MSTAEAPHDVIWVLAGYSKEDDFLRTTFPISRAQLAELREVIPPDPEDPWMWAYCYPVLLDVWPAVEKILRCGRPDPALEYQTRAWAAETTD
ncbi:hypothetical protein [Streptomyces luteireticuli]|uniref:DUF7683 domain-containing protein n=1 Tax=Streptomyces luteireticuli TaxID=173858 RepID=A0ABP3IS63_9ACTN